MWQWPARRPVMSHLHRRVSCWLLTNAGCQLITEMRPGDTLSAPRFNVAWHRSVKVSHLRCDSSVRRLPQRSMATGLRCVLCHVYRRSLGVASTLLRYPGAMLPVNVKLLCSVTLQNCDALQFGFLNLRDRLSIPGRPANKKTW